MLRKTSLRAGRVLLCTCLLTAMISGRPVTAQDASSPMADHVRIELRGHILPRCTFDAASTSMDLGAIGAISAHAVQTLDFQINCNAPFTYHLSSTHGAMCLDRDTECRPSTQLPYQATLTIMTDEGGSLTTDCVSVQLGGAIGGCTGNSAGHTAINKDGKLSVRWDNANIDAVAGRYEDDLRIAFGVTN